MKLERSYVDVVAPPRDEPVRRMRIGHLELPIPGWAIPVFGIIGILSVGYSFLNQPIQTIYSRYLLGTAEELDQQEAYKHFAEAPAMQLRDTGTVGTLEAKLFGDGCVSVAWRGGLSQSSPHPHFIRRITKDEDGRAPGPQTADGSRGAIADVRAAGIGAFEVDRLFDLLHAVTTPPGALPIRAVEQGHCVTPHPGSFTTSYGERKECWVQIRRKFSDGCEHYQWFNSCANYWDVNADGSPKVYWTQCRH